ncbi:MAG: hypothetical protein KDD40_12075, partial [Bdellovibrionales bacterium]|nr:hypothetical protein [Bdellovibrionales bacterium]
AIGLEMGNYTTANYRWFDLIVPRAHANVSSLKMCFKRLRFKLDDVDTTDPSLDNDNVDFDLGEVTLSSTGTYLGEVVIPAGTYKRIEFDLESDCVSGNSLELTNDNGSYTSNERITIKFSGLFEANVDGTLNLGVQTILNQLNNHNGAVSLKQSAEAASGDL